MIHSRGATKIVHEGHEGKEEEVCFTFFFSLFRCPCVHGDDEKAAEKLKLKTCRKENLF